MDVANHSAAVDEYRVGIGVAVKCTNKLALAKAVCRRITLECREGQGGALSAIIYAVARNGAYRIAVIVYCKNLNAAVLVLFVCGNDRGKLGCTRTACRKPEIKDKKL